MLFLYSIAYTLGVVVLLPAFLLQRQKYASGFSERLGSYPEFVQDDRRVIWLHCVSVGETNAARPLVGELLKQFPSHRLVVSTTTRTGQELAKKIFGDKADAVIYFPFDWKFSVRRALETFRPSLILLMETEIWPRFISEAKRAGAKVAIVNGRLSQKSYGRYSRVRGFVRRVMEQVDLALMQAQADADRVQSLGLQPARIRVTGNIKFDISSNADESVLTEYFCKRFGIDGEKLLIVAASTHEPEEKWVVGSLNGLKDRSVRLVVVPRHLERFEEVALLLADSGRSFVRRSEPETDKDRKADIILLDSIGELRAIYPLADIVFVGGSLVPHGGQSILEPAAVGKAIVTGYFTHNFADTIETFLKNDALIQLPQLSVGEVTNTFHSVLLGLLSNPARRQELGKNASAVMEANRGVTARTIEFLSEITGNL